MSIPPLTLPELKAWLGLVPLGHYHLIIELTPT